MSKEKRIMDEPVSRRHALGFIFWGSIAVVATACGGTAPPVISRIESVPSKEGTLPLSPENTPSITLNAINKLRPTMTDVWQGSGINNVTVMDGSTPISLQETAVWMVDHGKTSAPIGATFAMIDSTHPEKGAVYLKFADPSEFPGGVKTYADAINQMMETIRVQDPVAYQTISKIPNGGLLNVSSGEFAKVVVRPDGKQVVMTQMMGVSPRIAVEQYGIVLDESAYAEFAATLSKPVQVNLNGVVRKYLFDPEFIKNTAVVPNPASTVKLFPVDGALAEIVVGGDEVVVKGWLSTVQKIDPGTTNYAVELARDIANQSEGTPNPVPEGVVPRLAIEKSAMMAKVRGIITRMGSTLTVLSFATMPLQLLGDVNQIKKRIDSPNAEQIALNIIAEDRFMPGKRSFECALARSGSWQLTIPLHELPKEGQTPKWYWGELTFPDGSKQYCGDGQGGGDLLGASFSTHMFDGQEQFVMHFVIPQGQHIEISGITHLEYRVSLDENTNRPWIIDYKEARYSVLLPDGHQYFIDVIPGEALIFSSGIIVA